MLFLGLEMLMVTLRTEKDHVATECFSKTPSFVNNLPTEEKEMYWYLTSYAFDLVMSTFKSIKNIHILSLNEETQSSKIQSSEGVLLTSTIKCSF